MPLFLGSFSTVFFFLLYLGIIVAFPFVVGMIIVAVLRNNTATKSYFKGLVVEVALCYLVIALLWWKVVADDGYVYTGWQTPVQNYALSLMLWLAVIRLFLNLKKFWSDWLVCFGCGCLIIIYIVTFLNWGNRLPQDTFSPFQELSVFPSPDFRYEVVRYGHGGVKDIFGFRKRGNSRAFWLNGGCSNVRFLGWKDDRTMKLQSSISSSEILVTSPNPRLQCF